MNSQSRYVNFIPRLLISTRIKFHLELKFPPTWPEFHPSPIVILIQISPDPNSTAIKISAWRKFHRTQIPPRPDSKSILDQQSGEPRFKINRFVGKPVSSRKFQGINPRMFIDWRQDDKSRKKILIRKIFQIFESEKIADWKKKKFSRVVNKRNLFGSMIQILD